MYIDKVKIVEATDYSGKEPPFSGGEYQYDPRELAMEIKVGVEQLSFDPAIYVGGNLNRSATTPGKRWGNAWKVRAMLQELGLNTKEVIQKDGEGDGLKIAPEALKEIIGREIYKISYVTPSDKRREYDRIVVQQEGESDEQARNRLRDMFNSDVERGFVRYKPTPHAHEAELPDAIWEEDTSQPEPDDDLPF